MNSVLEAAFGSWAFQPWPMIGLLLTGIFYLRGWLRLRVLLPVRFPPWRSASFFLGLAFLYAAIASPLDAFSSLVLSFHMMQHLLLTMVVPPLLWMGAPFLPILCGLPRAFVRDAIGPLLIWKPVKTLGLKLTHPITCLALFMLMNIGWHLPSLYELALHSTVWHRVEHFCFLAAALLFWFPIIQPWPSRTRWPRWSMIPYILLADIQNTALAGFISFYDRVLYPTYENAPPLFGLTPLTDQATAAALMWVPGSIVFLIPLTGIVMQAFAPRRGVKPSEFFSKKTKAIKKTPIDSGRILDMLAHPQKSRAVDLLRIPALAIFARSNIARRSVQFLLFLLAAVIVIDGFMGPKVSPLNLAGVLPWTHWRGFSVIALLAVGNLFCMACPFTFARDLGRKILPANRSWPRLFRSKWIAFALLALYLWAYEAFRLWDSPWLTAWIIVGYFTAAILVDGFFKGASFCKYVCPIGQFNFVQSLLSPFEIKVRSQDTCASCKTHDCIRGNETQRGCELLLYQPRKSGNMDCTFCLDCVKACPHDNIGLIATPPAGDLFEEHRRSSVGRYALRMDLACLALLLVFGALGNAAGMVTPILALEDHLQATWGWSRIVSVSVFIFAGIFLFPAMLATLCTFFSHAGTKPETSRKNLFCDFAMTLVPLGATMWAAHFLFHLVTGFFTPFSILPRIASDWLGLPAMGVNPTIFSLPALPAMEILLLDFGVLLSLYAAWRIARRHAARNIFTVFLPWGLLALLLYLAGVWIIFQPMEMRGTLMP